MEGEHENSVSQILSSTEPLVKYMKCKLVLLTIYFLKIFSYFLLGNNGLVVWFVNQAYRPLLQCSILTVGLILQAFCQIKLT